MAATALLQVSSGAATNVLQANCCLTEEDHYVEYDEDEIQATIVNATIANVYNDPKRKLNEILVPLRITLKIFL